MDFIYPVSYLISLGGLIGWFFAQGNKRVSRKFSALFLTGFFFYLAALAFSSGTTPYKLLILFRDMFVLGVVSQLFNVFKRNILLSLILAFAAGLTLYFSYFHVLLYTFPQVETAMIDRDGEFFIQLDDSEETTIAAITNKFDCTVERAFIPANADQTTLDDYYLVNLANNEKCEIKRLCRYLNRQPAIAWIEPNERIQIEAPAATADVDSRHDFYFNDPGLRHQWGYIPMDVDALHRFLTESGIKPRKTATIAILDSGIDGEHEDLRDGLVTYRAAYNKDALGHGTHCAGIAGAVSNNGIGIASMTPTTEFVRIAAVRVMNQYGFGSQHSVIKGMIEAVDAGADVLSLSLGGPTQAKKERAYQEAVDYARKHGALVIVAAGNNGRNARETTPANIEGVITVAAVDRNHDRASFSNTVEDLKMALAAPGVDIYSTKPGNAYQAHSGTSMAAPAVAGLAGLMKSLYPDLTTEEAYAIMHKTGKKTKAGPKSGRLIQPFAAVRQLVD
ncbi:MAG: S8 family serine peptidase [Saprospiraceae bacterium]|nr:S8 family serine peptidase [Saprospiraceae bacterium]